MFSLEEMKDVHFLQNQGWMFWKRDNIRFSDNLTKQVPYPDYNLLLCPLDEVFQIPNDTIIGFVAPDINNHCNDNVMTFPFIGPAPIDFLCGSEHIRAITPLPDLKNWENEIVQRLYCCVSSLLDDAWHIEAAKKLSNIGIFTKDDFVLNVYSKKQYRSITEPFEPSCLI